MKAGHFFDIKDPGHFEVLALFEAAPLTEAGRTYLKVDQGWKSWSGRAVSKPVPITIALPVPLAPEK